MRTSKNQGYEKVSVGGVTHLFKADFSFLAALSDECEIDPFVMFAELNGGLGNPANIASILKCSLVSVAGEPVSPDDVEGVVAELITRQGIQEGAMIAKLMLSYAMIGDEKKQELHRTEAVQGILENLDIFQLKSLKRVLLQSAYLVAIFIICQCVSFKLLGPYIF